MHIRVLTPLVMNILSESFAGHPFTLPGRDEIRKREDGSVLEDRIFHRKACLSNAPMQGS
jgi:hypothetical protein